MLATGCGERRLTRAQIDTVLEAQIAESGEEASHWLSTAGADGYIKTVTQSFYARGARSVWLAEFMEVDEGRLPMRLIVEIPIDRTGREAVLECFNQVVRDIGIQQAERLVGNRYLMVPLDE